MELSTVDLLNVEITF